jgi:hypothetical protein
MPSESTTPEADGAIHAWAQPAPETEWLAAMAWWFSGGAALMAWTGIALLLTGA